MGTTNRNQERNIITKSKEVYYKTIPFKKNNLTEKEMKKVVALLLAVAILPGVYLIKMVYDLDKIEKEPADLLRRLFFWGVFSVDGICLLGDLVVFFCAGNAILGQIDCHMPYLFL